MFTGIAQEIGRVSAAPAGGLVIAAGALVYLAAIAERAISSRHRPA